MQKMKQGDPSKDETKQSAVKAKSDDGALNAAKKGEELLSRLESQQKKKGRYVESCCGRVWIDD